MVDGGAVSAAPTTGLAGRVALVTGSSRGIGRASTLRLAGMGADVVVNYRSDAQGAAEVVAAAEALGQRATAIQADVSEEADVVRLFQQIEATMGAAPTILVNNAGTTNDRLILQMKLEDFEGVIHA